MELNRNKPSNFKKFLLIVGSFPSLDFDYIGSCTLLYGKYLKVEAQSLSAWLPAQGCLQPWNTSTLYCQPALELLKPGQPVRIAMWALCAACAW